MSGNTSIKEMKALTIERQQLEGWNSQMVISVLCDYIGLVQSEEIARYDSHFKEYLGRRVNK